jgi:hypothetical protein
MAEHPPSVGVFSASFRRQDRASPGLFLYRLILPAMKAADEA